MLRNTLPVQIIAKERSCYDNQYNRACTVNSFLHNRPGIFPLQLLIDENTYQNAVYYCYSACLGRSEHTHAQAGDNTEREKQRPDRFLKLSHNFAEGSSLFTRRLIATLFGNNGNNNHHGYCHKNAGHIACHKHFSYGYAGNQRINNQVNSGRNNRRACGGCSCYRSTEGSAVTALFHFRNKHFTLHSSVSVSTAGNTAHQQAEQYVNLRQTAGHMTHEYVGKFHQLIADTSIVHDGACHNKEGNCQQRKGLRAGNNTLEYQMRRRSRIQKGKVGNRCTEQGISDWNTGKIKHKDNDDGQISHYFSSFPEPVTSCQTNLIEYKVMSTNAISTEELI